MIHFRPANRREPNACFSIRVVAECRAHFTSAFRRGLGRAGVGLAVAIRKILIARAGSRSIQQDNQGELMTVLLNVLLFSLAVVAPRSAPSVDPSAMSATFEVNGDQLTGTTTFATDKTGRVSGQLKLTTPLVINATLDGRVANGKWTFSFPFTMENHGVCTGTMSGTAKVAPGGASVSGTAQLKGHCDKEPVETWSATFTFSAAAKL